MPETQTVQLECTQRVQTLTDKQSVNIAVIQVRYRKGPHMQNSMCKLKLTLTLTDTGGAVLTLMLGYRSLYITWQ